MIRILIIGILLFIQNTGFCQDKSFLQNGNRSQYPFYFESKLSGEVYIPDNAYVGSPYLFNDWSKGDVSLKTGQVVHSKWLRYNGLTDDLIWRTDSSFQQVKLDKKLISEFRFIQAHEGAEYYFHKIRIPSWIKNDTIEVFAQILEKNDILSLYIIRRIIIEGHVADETSGHLILKQLLIPDTYYYLSIAGQPGLRFRKMNLKTFISKFPENAERIKSLMIEHHNKLRTQDEWVQIAKLIGTNIKKE
jgi:hypothetical protein